MRQARPLTQGALSLVEGRGQIRGSERVNTVAVEGTSLTGSGPLCVKACRLESSRHQKRRKAAVRGQRVTAAVSDQVSLPQDSGSQQSRPNRRSAAQLPA